MIILVKIKLTNYISSKKKSVENILDIFFNYIYKKNKNSNIDLGIKEHFLSTNILKKISSIRKKLFYNI